MADNIPLQNPQQNQQQSGIVRYWTVPTPLQGNAFIFGRVGCLDVNTEIEVLEDDKLFTKKLKDLPEFFNVYSYNFISKKLEVHHAKKINSDVKKGYKLTLSDGTTVVSSGEHIFYKPNGEQIKVSELKDGDNLLKIYNHVKK